MLILDATTKKLQVLLGGAKTTNDCPWVASWVDTKAATFSLPDSSNGVTSGATPVDTVASPGASTYRKLTNFLLINADTVATTVIIRYNDNGTTRDVYKSILLVNEVLQYNDGEGWIVTDINGAIKSSALNSGRLIRAPQVLTAGSSYTTPAGCTMIRVTLVAGGGGGGGVSNLASNAAAAGGGASGAVAIKTFLVAPSTAYTYAIGTNGTAGANTGGTGGTGGDTTFAVGGVTVTAKGGLGGVGMTYGTALAAVLGGIGVIATNGDVNGRGAPGQSGVRLSGTAAVSGAGGSSPYGGGGGGLITDAVGLAATGYGAGGGGACSLGTSARVGGVGVQGCIIVEEYY